jgi:hypothetical protein
MARSFVAKAVYGYPTARALIESLKTTPNLRRICGFVGVTDIPCEAAFSGAFAEFSESSLDDRVQINGGVNFRGNIVGGSRHFVRLDHSLGTTYAIKSSKIRGSGAGETRVIIMA